MHQNQCLMETNPPQRYNKYFDYASKIVKLCIESALFSALIVCMMTNQQRTLIRECVVVLIRQTWRMLTPFLLGKGGVRLLISRPRRRLELLPGVR